MPAEATGVADGLRIWWPIVGAAAAQLLALGAGIEIVRRLRSDFKDHDKKDDARFRDFDAKLDAKFKVLDDRIFDRRGGR